MSNDPGDEQAATTESSRGKQAAAEAQRAQAGEPDQQPSETQTFPRNARAKMPFSSQQELIDALQSEEEMNVSVGTEAREARERHTNRSAVVASRVKATFNLPVEDLAALEEIARRNGTNKTTALVRAIRTTNMLERAAKDAQLVIEGPGRRRREILLP